MSYKFLSTIQAISATFTGNSVYSNGTPNRTVKVDAIGLYLSRTSDGTYPSSISADGSMYYDTRNSHIFRNDGTASMTLFDNTRNVGIGTSTDAGYKLDVIGTIRSKDPSSNSNIVLTYGTGGWLQIFDTTPTETIRLRAGGGASYINTGQNFLIGTTTDAGYKLDVNGTARIYGASTSSLMIDTVGTADMASSITFRQNSPNWSSSIGTHTSGGGLHYGLQFKSQPSTVNFVINRDGSTYFGGFGLANSSSLVELSSTTKGFLQPRMTTTQRNAIATPATGLSIYNTTTNTEDYYNGSAWVSLQTYITNPVTGTGTTNYLSKWTSSSAIGNSLVYDDGTNVGIGTTSPSYKLDIVGNTRVGGSGNTRLYIDTSNTATPNIGFALAVSNAAKWSVAAYKPSGTNISYVLYNEQTGTNSLFIQGDTNNVIVGGTSDSGYKLDVLGTGRYGGNLLVSLNQNAETSFSVSNTTSGTTSQSSIKAVSSGGGLQLGKVSAGWTTYKSLVANDGYLYNYSAGNISILNDYGSGNINFTSRGSSAAQVIFNGDSQPLALIGGGSSNFSMNSGNDVYFYFNSQSAVGRFYANPQGSVQNTYDQPTSVGFVGVLAGASVWYGNMNTNGGSVKYNASINGVSHSHIWYHNFSEQMRLAYTGNLLIGTATDAGYKLDVNGTARINSTLALTNSTYAGTFSFYLSAANVFQASSSNIGVWLQVGGGNRVYIIGQEFNSTSRGNIFGNTVGGEAISATTIIAQSSGTTATTGLSLRYTINNTGTYVGISRGIYYNPTITSLTGTTHRAIETVTGDVIFGSTSGNVGIGTTSPTEKLSVNGNMAFPKSGNTFIYNDQSGADSITIGGASYFSVKTFNGANYTEVFRATSTNNLLIGTTTDAGYKLQVNGTGYVSSTLQVGTGGYNGFTLQVEGSATFGDTVVQNRPLNGNALGGITSYQSQSNLTYNFGNGTYSGETISGELANSVQVGQVVAMRASTLQWDLADASTAASIGKNMIGIACENGGAGNTITILLCGFFASNSFYSSSSNYGAPMYLDATQPGFLTDIAPSTTGNIVRIAGHIDDYSNVNSSVVVRFNPDNFWLVI